MNHLTPHLELMIEKEASDLFLTANSPVKIKIDGKIISVGKKVLSPDITKKIAQSIMNKEQQKIFNKTMECDLSLIHICRCRLYSLCRSRWSPYH
mgnify:CR=1 FL=1